MHFEDHLYAMIVFKVKDTLQFKMKLSSWYNPPTQIFPLRRVFNSLVFTKSAQPVA